MLRNPSDRVRKRKVWRARKRPAIGGYSSPSGSYSHSGESSQGWPESEHTPTSVVHVAKRSEPSETRNGGATRATPSPQSEPSADWGGTSTPKDVESSPRVSRRRPRRRPVNKNSQPLAAMPESSPLTKAKPKACRKLPSPPPAPSRPLPKKCQKVTLMPKPNDQPMPPEQGPAVGGFWFGYNNRLDVQRPTVCGRWIRA